MGATNQSLEIDLDECNLTLDHGVLALGLGFVYITMVEFAFALTQTYLQLKTIISFSMWSRGGSVSISD